MSIIFLSTKAYSYAKEMSYISSLNQTLSIINYTKGDNNNEKSGVSFSKRILDSQLLMKNSFIENNNIEDENMQSEQQQVSVDENMTNEEDIKQANENVETQVVEENNIKATYTDIYSNVEIKNSSKYELTEEILNPDIVLDNKKDIIILHTHTCESYTPTEKFSYNMTGNFRTTDLNYSVSRVGDELAKYLQEYGYNVNHDKSVNDYPAYTGSYNRSLEAVRRDLEKNSSTQIIFDLHRDAVGSMNNYAPTVKIGDEYVAQIMFVIGTDGGGLNHPNWQQNLKFAIKVQQKANELYPGLFRPIIVRDSRYNQHVSKAASIIEVGATGNTLEQCLGSMKYFSKVLDEVLKE